MFDLAVLVTSCLGLDAGTLAVLLGSFDLGVAPATVLDLSEGGGTCGFATVLPATRRGIAGLPSLVLLLSLFLPLCQRRRCEAHGDENAEDPAGADPPAEKANRPAAATAHMPVAPVPVANSALP